MAQSNVKNYTDAEILNRIKTAARNFNGFPANFWLVG